MNNNGRNDMSTPNDLKISPVKGHGELWSLTIPVVEGGRAAFTLHWPEGENPSVIGGAWFAPRQGESPVVHSGEPREEVWSGADWVFVTPARNVLDTFYQDRKVREEEDRRERRDRTRQERREYRKRLREMGL
jgi:hypothetical protein